MEPLYLVISEELSPLGDCRMNANRREFLQASAAAAACAAISAAAEEGKSDTIPIVDTHQHLWDLSRFKLPWLKEGSELARSYITKDYLEAARGLNVAKTVYMEVDVDPKQQLAEADYVAEVCKDPKNLTVAAVISGRPASDGFREYITRFKGSKVVKGIRQVLHNPDMKAGYCLEPSFVKGIQLLGELGLSFDLCMRPGELGDGVKLVERCPGTRFIVDHCGNCDLAAFKAAGKDEAAKKKTDQYKRDMAGFAKRDRVMCKISGVVAQLEKGKWTTADLAPTINFCLDTFGPDRVMFGSDWPVCTLGATYREWVTALREIIASRSSADQKKLLHDNAVKFYGLG
jgi:L-fuconolactonase